MIKNKSIENSSLTTNEVDSKITDIFEQIRKKSEEMPSSESSIKLLHNLSNPTNLTNPQIIMNSKHFEEKIESRKIAKNVQILKKIRLKNRLLFSTGNSPENFQKSKSQKSLLVNQSTNLIQNDKLFQNMSNIDSLKNTQRNKIILKKIDKKSLNKNRKNQNLHNYNNNYTALDYRHIKKKIFSPEIIYEQVKSVDSRDPDDIWQKLKSSKCIEPYDKNKKIEEIKYFKKINFRNDIYHIKIIQYNNRNKNERYQKFLANRDSQLKSLDETMKQVEKSKQNIEKIYDKEYISYISFLKNNIEKENIKSMELINQKNGKLMEIRLIQNKINKIKENKKNLIKWLYLQIQVKEKLMKIPDYYKYIIEEELSLNEINKKKKININQNEYNRILDYKGKNIYPDVNKFFEIYEKLEIKSLERLKKNDEIEGMRLQLKFELEKYNNKFKTIASDENIKIKESIKELKMVKMENIKLNTKLNEIKNNIIIDNTKNKNNKYLNNLSNKVLFHSKSDPNINTSNYNYYKIGKPLLFNLVLFLYKWVSQNKFKEMEKYSINLNNYLTDEKNMLNILEYAELVINLLLVQKKHYYSNNKLKEKYEKIEEIVDKDIKREKFLILLKIEEQKEIEKSEKVKEKMKKKYFKYNRKIDLDYFRKEMNKKNKIKLNKIEKRETKFEDFFYDID